MPKKLEELKKKIWARLEGKTNPRTKKPYTESEAWAIATAQFKESGKNLSISLEDFEEPSELLTNAIKIMEER